MLTKISLSAKIFVGLFVGLTIGTLVQYVFSGNAFLDSYVVGTATAVGDMFVSLIKLLVVPLVFISIVSGICELKDVKSLGRLGGKTFGLYLINTVIAIVAALTVGMIFAPGATANLVVTGAEFDIAMTTTPDIGELVKNIIPSNPVQAFANGDMLQIIFMAIVTAIAIQGLGRGGDGVASSFKTANSLMMKLITMVMSLAPYGVFALMIQLGATLDSHTIFSVMEYVGLVVAMLMVWIVVIYPTAVWAATGIKPLTFLSAVREQLLFSLSTASSNATIPVTMRTLTEKLQVSKSIAGFGVPMGATMNMSGVAIYIALAIIFVGNAYGQPIEASQLIAIGATVFLLSIGAGGVPGGGIVMVGVLIHQLGLPMEALAIIAAVDRINDMFCTSANVIGDTAVNTIVAKSENAIGIEEQPEPVMAEKSQAA